MSIRLKTLFDFKDKLKGILDQHWSDSTRKEIEARIKDIEAEIEEVRQKNLVAA